MASRGFRQLLRAWAELFSPCWCDSLKAPCAVPLRRGFCTDLLWPMPMPRGACVGGRTCAAGARGKPESNDLVLTRPARVFGPTQTRPMVLRRRQRR